jgi:hypothetical protein
MEEQKKVRRNQTKKRPKERMANNKHCSIRPRIREHLVL